MPLYTYVIHYKGKTCVEQERRSNYRGFAPLVLGQLMEHSMAMPKALQQEAVGKAFRAPWSIVPNRSSVWRQAFEFHGSELEIYAVQTKE